MIYLYTGTPGHGKTQRALWALLNDDRFKGRPVLYANVRGLNTDDERIKNWIPLTDIADWKKAPEGAVILVDECHQSGFFPLRGVGKPPQWIEDLATHRHFGLDFILITQNAKNMDVFVRRLVESHTHIKRPAQMGYTNIYEFQGYTDCDDRIPADSALKHERWKLDPKIWTLYKSAEVHTAKAKIPRIVYVLPLCIILFLVAISVAVFWFKKMGAPPPNTQASQLVKGGNGSTSKGGGAADALEVKTPLQRAIEAIEIKRQLDASRIPIDRSYPESAPIYDEVREIKTFPKLAACATMRGKCQCYNQQGIIERSVPEPTCYLFVADGRFDPYRDEEREAQAELRKANQRTANDSKQPVERPYLVTGLSGHSWYETRSQGYSGGSTDPFGVYGQPRTPAILNKQGGSGGTPENSAPK